MRSVLHLKVTFLTLINIIVVFALGKSLLLSSSSIERACDVGKWSGDSTTTTTSPACYDCPAKFQCNGIDPFPVPCPPDTRALEASGICCPQNIACSHPSLAVDNNANSCACVSIQCKAGQSLIKAISFDSDGGLECADVAEDYGCQPCVTTHSSNNNNNNMMVQDTENCQCFRIPPCLNEKTFWKHGDKYACF